VNPVTLERFQAETGTSLPSLDPIAAAPFLAERVSQVWVDWKCHVVVDVIRQVKETARRYRPDIQLILNTLPFGRFADMKFQRLFKAQRE
jgi:hypothetical protein